MTRLFAIALFALAVYLAHAIGLALSAESVFVAGPLLARQPWGWVTLIDLYLGFLVTAAFVVARERRARPIAFWLIAIFVLGNLASAAYVLLALARSHFELGSLSRAASAAPVAYD